MNDSSYHEGGCGCDGGAGAAVTGGAGGVASSLYSGSASLGRAFTTIGAVVACLIAVVLIIIGVTQIKSPRTKSAMATVTKIVAKNTVPAAKGDSSVTYTVDATFADAAGKTIALTNLPMSSKVPVVVSSKFKVYYDPANPGDALFESASPRNVGIGLIVGGVVLAGVGIGVAVLARKSKAFAALEGVAGTASVLQNIV